MTRVTKKMIEKDIKSIKYIYEGRSVICIVTLHCGFDVIGKAQCSPRIDYKPELGEKYSLEDAFDKLFELYTFWEVRTSHLKENPKPLIPSTAPIAYYSVPNCS